MIVTRVLLTHLLAVLIAACPFVCSHVWEPCGNNHEISHHDINGQRSDEHHHPEHPVDHSPALPCHDSDHDCICHGATLTAKVRSFHPTLGTADVLLVVVGNLAGAAFFQFFQIECLPYGNYDVSSGRQLRTQLQSFLI